MKILLAEDEPMIRSFVSAVLEGHSIVETSNGAEAFEAFKREPFDLVITDIQMPVMSGFELQTKIHEINPKQKIIGMSGTDMLKGVNGFLRKPFMSEDLIKAVEAIK